MSGACQVYVKYKTELDIGGRETCLNFFFSRCLRRNFGLFVYQALRMNFSETQPMLLGGE